MKSIITLLLFIFIVNSLNAQLWLVDPLEAIYPDENQLIGYNHKWKADFPFGTTAGVHVLVKIPKGESFDLIATKDGKDLGTGVWCRLIDVPVE